MKKLTKWGRAYLMIMLISLTSMAQGYAASSKFTISEEQDVATIYVADDESYTVRRAVGDLQNDLELITGKKVEITNDLNSISGRAIIVGEASNPLIKELVSKYANGKGESLEGIYESFLIKPIKSPTQGVKEALLVAGSDALGAVYGAYQISELAGLSPLYWWCDTTPDLTPNLTIDGAYILPKEPSVRYRGIFLNDEEALIKWSSYTSVNGRDKGITPESYRHIFELILRMRANMLWPSMMEAGHYFFQDKDENGVAINPRTATEYGIYIGASHCEQMGRNNYDEWYNWAAENQQKYNIAPGLEFDYTVNPVAIEGYWRERVEESKDFNMIYTIGIRGVHDMPYQCRLLENPTLENRVKFLQNVINRQRQMIKEIFGSEDGARQIFVPYEETGELYNGESKDGSEHCKGLDLPEDVMIVTTEDNHGYLRQTPTPKELLRKGGNGFYYHLAYQGSPSTYDWLTTTPYVLLQEQLTKGYDAGAKDYWIVNVGDIKPAEMGILYFMKMANDIDYWRSVSPRKYVAEQSKTLFGTDEATSQRIADLYCTYTQQAYKHRPEFMGSFSSIDFDPRGQFQYYSTFDFGDEALRVIQSYAKLRGQAEEIYDTLHEGQKMAFWHLVYYPIRSAHNMAERCYYYQRNYHYANQGRFASVNKYKELSEQAHARIDEDLELYNTMLDGKWKGITDPYATYNLTERVFDIACIPEDLIYKERFNEQSQDGIGSVCEGQKYGDESVTLRFSKGEDNSRFIDLFNLENGVNSYQISADKDWVKISRASGDVAVEERIWLSIDWATAPEGLTSANVTVSSDGFSKSYPISIENYNIKLKSKSYMEGCGYATIEAEHYSRKVDGKDGAKWSEYPDYGYVGSSMFVKGDKINKVTNLANGARLEYDIYFNTTGTHQGYLYRIPTLNEGKGKSVEIAVGLDDAKAQTLQGVRAKSSRFSTKLENGFADNRNWFNNVGEQMEKIPFTITVDKVGYHTLKLYQRDSDIGVDRVVIATQPENIVVLNRSVVGAPISYNSFGVESVVEGAELPELTDVEVCDYPDLEPLLYAKFGFSKYACPSVWGFTMISPMNVYDPNTNLYGWSAESVKNVKFKHHESMRRVPHWKRDCNYGSAPATFKAYMTPGKYELNLYTGDYYNEYSQKPGWDYQMSVVANGKVLMDDQTVVGDNPHTGCYEVIVGDDNVLEIEFSGSLWAISAIELYHK
ncbi:MAG: glycosyl hydrolase 115 family protein [Rikenellaceae bacterium]